MERPGPTSVQGARRRQILTADGRIERAPMIDDPELDAMRAADRARDEELHPFSAEGKRRLRIYILGSCVFFPLANWFFTPSGFNGLWLQLLIAIAYGAFVAIARPGTFLCAVVTLLAGMLIQAYDGIQTGVGANFTTLLAMILYTTAGGLLGFRENDRQIDR